MIRAILVLSLPFAGKRGLAKPRKQRKTRFKILSPSGVEKCHMGKKKALESALPRKMFTYTDDCLSAGSVSFRWITNPPDMEMCIECTTSDCKFSYSIRSNYKSNRTQNLLRIVFARTSTGIFASCAKCVRLRSRSIRRDTASCQGTYAERHSGRRGSRPCRLLSSRDGA